MTENASIAETYRSLHESVVRFTTTRDVVRVTGPDAISYLEGQCSQHVSDLTFGQSVETLILSPQGKIDAYAQVALDHEGAALVVVDEGYGETTYERLRRFKLRVKAELELISMATVCVRGPKSASYRDDDGTVAIEVNWPGVTGIDFVGSTPRALDNIEEGDPDALEIARIEAGIPLMGREITEKTIPQETNIVERTVSFSKGCYTGQELVARLDARGGRTPRKLRGVLLTGVPAPERVAAGDALVIDDREIGTITSCGYSPRVNAVVGLAYVRREITPPSEASVVLGDGERVPATIEELPLITP